MSLFLSRPGVVGGAEVGGGEGEEIDLPNLPDRQENADLEQDDLPVNAGGRATTTQCMATLTDSCDQWGSELSCS